MKQEIIDNIQKTFELTVVVKNYLFDYLDDKIQELIDDYELTEDLIDEINIVGYNYLGNVIVIFVMFPDEICESGYGIEEYKVITNDFIDWLKNKN